MAADEGYEYTESSLTPLEGSGYDNLNALEKVKLEKIKDLEGILTIKIILLIQNNNPYVY